MGIVAGLLSAVFASAKDLLSKRLAYQIDGMTSTFASFFCALPFYAVVLAWLYEEGYETLELTSTFMLLVVARSLTDVLAEGMKMYAFSHADISVVACVFSMSPLLLLITSPLLTGDPLSAVTVLGTLVVVTGSFLLVYRPSDRTWSEQKKGILLALGASFFFALNSSFDRLAVRPGTGTPVMAGFAMTYLSCVILLPLIVFRSDRVGGLWRFQGGLWLRGLLEVAFMSAKLYALVHLQAPYVVNIQRVGLLFSILGGRVFFREPDFARRLAAGLLILMGAMWVMGWDEIYAWMVAWGRAGAVDE